MAELTKLALRLDRRLHQAARVKATLLGIPLETVVGKLLEEWVGKEFMARLEAIAREVAAEDARIVEASGGVRPEWMDSPKPTKPRGRKGSKEPAEPADGEGSRA